MKKIVLAIVLVSGLVFASLKLVPTFASGGVEHQEQEPEREPVVSEVTADSEEEVVTNEPRSLDELRPTERQVDNLQDLATELGIATEGKDQETFIEEVRSEAIKQRAAEVGLSVEGKDEEVIIEELQEKYADKEVQESQEPASITKEDARNQIKRNPVDTGGKSLEEFKQEKQDELMEIAQKYGITTEGKSLEEIFTELKEVTPEQ